MRCLYLLASSEIGGGNRSMRTIWQGLQKLRVEPWVVCPGDGPVAEDTGRLGIPYEIFEYEQPSWRKPVLTYRNHNTWCRLIKESQAALVHANSPHSARSISLSAWRLGLPVVCHVRFGETDDYLHWAFRNLPKPRVFVFNSNALRDRVWPTLSTVCNGSSQTVIYNAVKMKEFLASPKPSGRVVRIGIIANLMPVKRHEDFLHMAAILSKSKKEIEFWIIGDDIHGTGRRGALEELAKTLGLENVVKFFGHRSDVAQLIQQLTLIVCCSREEPFGRCLIEAMSCGRPVVATKVGGIPEVVKDGITGFLVPPERPDALAEKVRLLLENEALWKKMSQAAVEHVRENFALEGHAQNIYKVYQDVLGCR